jgi:hypothetical protein
MILFDDKFETFAFFEIIFLSYIEVGNNVVVISFKTSFRWRRIFEIERKSFFSTSVLHLLGWYGSLISRIILDISEYFLFKCVC